MNAYLMLGERVGTAEARDLAAQVHSWHDAMVTHLRAVRRGAAACSENCPHGEARILWAMALDIFGPDTGTLDFLRTHGVAAPDRRMKSRASRLGS